mgnify:CR=1 FL=1
MNHFSQLTLIYILTVIYQKLELDVSKKWIFYPSEFIPHKNHIYIIDTLNFLNDEKYKNINFVFTGSDGGNLSYIKKMIKLNNLNNRVKIFNYLENNLLENMYVRTMRNGLLDQYALVKGLCSRKSISQIIAPTQHLTDYY